MEIYRDIERFGTLENRPEEFVIEITTLNMAIEERSLETVIPVGSLQFGGSGIGVCGRQRGKSGETSRMTPQGIGKEIVRFAGERQGLSNVELLCAGRSKRQYLHVDVSGVHFGDPLVSQLAELFQEFRRGAAEFQSLFSESSTRTIEESRAREMFLQGYRSHKRSIL